MATRTAKGTAQDKASTTTLTLASVSCNEGDALIIFVGNQTQNVPTSVAWGARELTKTAHIVNTTAGLTASIWIARKLVNTATRDVTVTWGTAIAAKAIGSQGRTIMSSNRKFKSHAPCELLYATLACYRLNDSLTLRASW